VSSLCRIVYCSRSLLKGSRSDIEVQIRQILATARTRNPEAGLTGALTFNESCFAQVLEGADDDLALLYEKIRRDPRHTDVKILMQDNPTRRLFPSWSMAYVGTLSGHRRHPLAHFSFEAALTHGAAPEARLLLDALCQVVVAKTKLGAIKDKRF
jgi:hypothetical protein